jgi:hypothetical protein
VTTYFIEKINNNVHKKLLAKYEKIEHLMTINSTHINQLIESQTKIVNDSTTNNHQISQILEIVSSNRTNQPSIQPSNNQFPYPYNYIPNQYQNNLQNSQEHKFILEQPESYYNNDEITSNIEVETINDEEINNSYHQNNDHNPTSDLYEERSSSSNDTINNNSNNSGSTNYMKRLKDSFIGSNNYY